MATPPSKGKAQPSASTRRSLRSSSSSTAASRPAPPPTIDFSTLPHEIWLLILCALESLEKDKYDRWNSMDKRGARGNGNVWQAMHPQVRIASTCKIIRDAAHDPRAISTLRIVKEKKLLAIPKAIKAASPRFINVKTLLFSDVHLQRTVPKSFFELLSTAMPALIALGLPDLSAATFTAFDSLAAHLGSRLEALQLVHSPPIGSTAASHFTALRSLSVPNAQARINNDEPHALDNMRLATKYIKLVEALPKLESMTLQPHPMMVAHCGLDPDVHDEVDVPAVRATLAVDPNLVEALVAYEASQPQAVQDESGVLHVASGAPPDVPPSLCAGNLRSCTSTDWLKLI